MARVLTLHAQTYQSHWDYDSSHVVVKSSILQAVLAANFATGLTFEFYPRVHANTVNFTIGPEIAFELRKSALQNKV